MNALFQTAVQSNLSVFVLYESGAIGSLLSLTRTRRLATANAHSIALHAIHVTRFIGTAMAIVAIKHPFKWPAGVAWHSHCSESLPGFHGILQNDATWPLERFCMVWHTTRGSAANQWKAYEAGDFIVLPANRWMNDP